jgi:hypothetical protein
MQGLHREGKQTQDEGAPAHNTAAAVIAKSIARAGEAELIRVAFFLSLFLVQSKHIPVHLRKRNLHEQTEKASRILAEELESQDGGVSSGAHGSDNGFVSAARAPLLISSAGRHPEEEEQVKLSDILELVMELLELVEGHVARSGSQEDVARFEAQVRVLRAGRDRLATQRGHVEDKRAIVLAFSIFTEHYTLTLRDYDKLLSKNAALKQLAYDTAGLVKKSEAQFESYVRELKSLQGANFEVAHHAKVELTQLRNEVTALKLELNLRTNELREVQLDANATSEQLQRERQRAEDMRKDKDARITSLLAQLQQFSLDYAHEKGERLRLERENERLWNDRMAWRAEQIRSSTLSGAERALALERDALEKREWLEWVRVTCTLSFDADAPQQFQTVPSHCCLNFLCGPHCVVVCRKRRPPCVTCKTRSVCAKKHGKCARASKLMPMHRWSRSAPSLAVGPPRRRETISTISSNNSSNSTNAHVSSRSVTVPNDSAPTVLSWNSAPPPPLHLRWGRQAGRVCRPRTACRPCPPRLPRPRTPRDGSIAKPSGPTKLKLMT